MPSAALVDSRRTCDHSRMAGTKKVAKKVARKPANTPARKKPTAKPAKKAAAARDPALLYGQWLRAPLGKGELVAIGPAAAIARWRGAALTGAGHLQFIYWGGLRDELPAHLRPAPHADDAHVGVLRYANAADLEAKLAGLDAWVRARDPAVKAKPKAQGFVIRRYVTSIGPTSSLDLYLVRERVHETLTGDGAWLHAADIVLFRIAHGEELHVRATADELVLVDAVAPAAGGPALPAGARASRLGAMTFDGLAVAVWAGNDADQLRRVAETDFAPHVGTCVYPKAEEATAGAGVFAAPRGTLDCTFHEAPTTRWLRFAR